MKIRGVCYDVGTVYGAGAFSISTRPVFDAAVTHREVEIIGRDLHCNAVRIRGRGIARLMTAAQAALQQGLDVSSGWPGPRGIRRGECDIERTAAGAAPGKSVRTW
jgi:hypothetical protein